MTEQTVSPEVQELFDFLTLMKKEVKELAKLEAEIQTYQSRYPQSTSQFLQHLFLFSPQL
jgi:hypothetical protein